MHCVFVCAHERAFGWYNKSRAANPGVACTAAANMSEGVPVRRRRRALEMIAGRAASLIGGSKVTLRFVLAKLWIFAAEMSSRAALKMIHIRIHSPDCSKEMRWEISIVHFLWWFVRRAPLISKAREESNYHLLCCVLQHESELASANEHAEGRY